MINKSDIQQIVNYIYLQSFTGSDIVLGYLLDYETGRVIDSRLTLYSDVGDIEITSWLVSANYFNTRVVKN